MNPFLIFFILLITIPIVEVYFLIQVGSVIGAFSTVVLIVFTAVLGAYLLRLQGMATVQRVQKTLQQGELPAIDMLEGVVLLLSGVLLLTPGFFTDAVGFLCLIPLLRRNLVLAFLKGQFVNSASFKSQPFKQQSTQFESRENNIIEGEFKREDDTIDKK